MWQAIQGIFDALLIAGLIIAPIGIVALGVAMLGSPAFGKGFGWVSLVLGVLGVVAVTVLLVDPLSNRRSRHLRTHHFLSRPGLESLQSVEGRVGSLEDEEKGRARW
jgi:hypothetical protein